jgi:acyl-CoA reductase-like NAD-dependent aldehyde dehydrogenase
MRASGTKGSPAPPAPVRDRFATGSREEGGFSMASTATAAAPGSGAMSGSARSGRESSADEIDRAVASVREKADTFARLPVKDRIALLRSVMEGVSRAAREWVEAGCRAKGLAIGTAAAGEEWLAGPSMTLRNARLLAESLEEVAAHGRPRLGAGASVRPDGRLEVSVFPTTGKECVLFSGFSVACLMEQGVDEKGARARQAAFYQQKSPGGRVAVVLGAGNVSSIPPGDVFYKMFVEGSVCVLKMNPVNEWVGPILERALAPLLAPGYLRIVYGGGAAGAALNAHPMVDEVHITGSDRTHDLIVWGPPGAERDRRMKSGQPLLSKRITSELGNVSPVAIVPGEYTDAELAFQAANVVSMVVNNGSFNCNAGKVIVTARGWRQRDAFLDGIRRMLGLAPVREAYYPGAFERYEMLLSGRPGVEKFGTGTRTALPWAMVTGVDSARADEPFFRVEPFCGVVCEAPVGSVDPVAFLAEATSFMNDRIWGTLNAMIVIPPRLERDPAVAAALHRAIVALRYGTVAINHWPALGYGLVTPPWGGHPSATLADIQSGLGWVHNTFMLDGIDKSVVRGPITVSPKPAWFFDNRQAHVIGEKLVAFERAPAWSKVPGIAWSALFA